jgi:hypothetical protein
MDVKKVCVPAYGRDVQLKSPTIVFRQDFRPFAKVYR